MKLIQIALVLLGSVFTMHAFEDAERIETFAGSKVSIHLKDGGELIGRLGHVEKDSILLEPLKPGQGASTALAVKNILTIRRLGFRDSPAAKFLSSAPERAIEYPMGVLILGMLSLDRLITGRWPEGP